MFSATTHTIRPATAADTAALELLARLDSQRAPSGPVLIGERHGEPVAAIEIDTLRVIADPFEPTAGLAVHLRMRASGIRAQRSMPTVRERIAAGLRAAAA